MNYLIEEETFLSLCTETKRNIVKQIPTPTIRAPINNAYARHVPQFGQGIGCALASTSGYKPNFPSQPIQITQRNLPKRIYFTNQQVFGKPKNVWKPTGKLQKNQLPLCL